MIRAVDSRATRTTSLCFTPGVKTDKICDEAVLLPGDHAAMLSTRAEAQVAGDWMVVPVARNLHWRYAVLHSAFVCCKQKVLRSCKGNSLEDTS